MANDKTGVAAKRAAVATWAALLLIVGVGAFFRFAGLEQVSLRADTINLWRVCQAEMSVSDIISRWGDLGLDHPQLTLIAIRLYHQITGTELTHFSFRVMPVVFGLLCIPLMYAFGATIGDRRLGLILALLTAISPFHSQVSREAYHYSLLGLGSTVLLFAVGECVRSVRGPNPVRVRFYVSLGVGFFLILQSTYTGWTIGALECAACLLLLLVGRRKRIFGWNPLLISVGVLTAVSLPILFLPWGLPHILGKMGAADKELGARVLAATDGNLLTLLGRVLTSFGLGAGALRVAATLGLLASAVATAWLVRSVRFAAVVLLAVAAAGLVVFELSRSATSAMYESRYVFGLLPLYLTFLGLGLWGWIDGFGGRWPRLRPAGIAWLLLVLILLLPPAVAVTRLTGNAIPYRAVVSWFDENLPSGTPVLVERWLDPWNELSVYPSTNVIFTFTIPNEPLDRFLQYNWRKTAEEFLRKYPDAAYLEMSKTYWNVPGVGPFRWPRDYFARHVVIANEAGIDLRNWGLANRGDFYGPFTNGLIAEIFYNTLDDVLERARRERRETLIWYGPGWGYTKLWRQIQDDFRDWRVLTTQAELDVYNLTDSPMSSVLTIQGVALGQDKMVRTDQGAQKRFTAGRIEPWTLGPLSLEPGRNRIVLRDRGSAAEQIPLLVSEVRCERAAGMVAAP